MKWLDLLFSFVTGRLAVLHLLVVDSLVLLDRSLGGVRSRCSQFPQSLAGSWVIRDTSPQLLSMSLLPTS